MTNNNLSEVQAFVKEKCGGLTLQHILNQGFSINGFRVLPVNSYENVLDFIVQILSTDPEREYREVFQWVLLGRNNRTLTFMNQTKPTQLAIAKLLGYKDKEEHGD